MKLLGVVVTGITVVNAITSKPFVGSAFFVHLATVGLGHFSVVPRSSGTPSVLELSSQLVVQR